jgi:hypothetical protein
VGGAAPPHDRAGAARGRVAGGVAGPALRLDRATLYAALQAGRGRICVAPYRWRHDQWQRIGDIALTTWPDLVPELDKGAVVSGELDREGLKILGQQAGRVTIASPAQRLRRAGYLAELGWKRLAEGERDDPAVLQPIYLQTV